MGSRCRRCKPRRKRLKIWQEITQWRQILNILFGNFGTVKKRVWGLGNPFGHCYENFSPWQLKTMLCQRLNPKAYQTTIWSRATSFRSSALFDEILNCSMSGQASSPVGERWAGASDFLAKNVLRIFFKILVMRANFGDFGILVSTSKFWKKFVTNCYPILGQILENFDFRILVKSQSYDKPPWRNFDFWSNFVEIENFGF